MIGAKDGKPLSTNITETTPEDLQTFRDSLRAIWYQLMMPPQATSLSEWSDNHIVLGGTNPEPGAWRTSRTPYLKEILDVCGDTKTNRIVVMASAQVGKSSVLLNTAGFYSVHDPCPIMVVQPDKSMADTFSVTKLDPIIQSSPILRRTIASTRKRDGGSKKLEKVFNGGFIKLVSAKSAHSLRSTSIRTLLLDEVDAYVNSLGQEGDPVKLAEARTKNFQNISKTILTSTPTVMGFSRIEKEFKKSDQRHYTVPCPHCQHYQALQFGTDETPYGLKWSKDTPTNVSYECEACHTLIHESHKLYMMSKGTWVKHNPESTVAGFHISALYSPWSSWASVVKEYLDVYKLPEKRQSFYNLTLGLPYEDTENTVVVADLLNNISVYGSAVPKGVGVLVCGIDVQESWIEAAVWGFGKDEEMWLIETVQLVGETTQQHVWDELAYFLAQKYQTHSGQHVGIEVAAIDSGNQTPTVLKQVKALRAKGINIYPIKGFDGARAAFDWSKYSQKGGVKLGIVGSSSVKSILYSRLKKVTKQGAGFIHFPSSVHNDILEQILSERKVVVFNKNNVPQVMWKRLQQRNEQLDCMVYAYAMLQALGTGFLNVKLPENIANWGTEPTVVVTVPDEPPAPRSSEMPRGFTKRTTLQLPRRSRSLMNNPFR